MMLYFVAVSNNVYADDVQFTQKTYKILFVGNSHTYYNDMPKMFKGLCDADKINCKESEIKITPKALELIAVLAEGRNERCPINT